jgi:hypothetical protein
MARTDELDRAGGRHGHLERARVGVADVLGGEHDHPPGDVLGVLAAGDHHRQPVDGGVGVGATQALDEGRDDVVVLVAAAVVEQRVLAGGVVDVLRGDLAAGRRRGRRFQDVQRVARVAAGGVHDRGSRLLRQLDAERPRAPLHDPAQRGLVQGIELVELAA